MVRPRRDAVSQIGRVLAGSINRHTIARTLVATGVFGVLITAVFANMPSNTALAGTGINQQINFQGKLVNTDGTNIPDGTYNMEFNIYTGGNGCVGGGSSPCSGTLQWTEDYLRNNSQGVSVSAGIFQVSLGSITSLPTSIFNNDTIWMSINLGNTNATCTPFSSCGGDGEMLPFIRYTAAPYAFNSLELGGLTASQFAQLSPSSAQSGSLNVTGSVQAATSLQAPLVDTATGVALDIGTGTATSVTIGRTSTPFTIQGNSSSTLTSTNSGHTTTVGFATPTVSSTLNFSSSTAGTYTICTSEAATCSGTYLTSLGGSFLAKNSADTSSAAITAANYLYGFTNSQATATTGGVLDLSNGANTGNTLYVTASGNPAASTNALVVVNNTAATPSGNLLDLQAAGANQLTVDYQGNLTQNGGSSTTDTINGQTISAAANFTGTVTATTSVLTPLVDTASAGVLNIGTNNATQIALNANTTVAHLSDSAFGVVSPSQQVLLGAGTKSDANGFINYITDPEFGLGSGSSLTDWSVVGSPTTFSQNTTSADSYEGNTSLKLVTTATAGQGATTSSFTSTPPTATSDPGEHYTASFEVMQTTGTAITANNLKVQATQGANTPNCTGSATQTLTANGFEQVSCTLTFTAAGTISALQITSLDTHADTFYIGGVQLQQGQTATAFDEGSLGLRGVITNPVSIQNTINSTTELQVQNSSGADILGVNSIGGQVVLGSANSVSGSLVLQDASSSNSATVQLQGALPGNATYQLPNVSGTQVICTTLSTTACTSVYQAAGSYLLQNPAANDASTSNFAGYQYSFTQNNTGASGNLSLTNAGTNPSLSVAGTGNPTGTNALVVINNSAGAPSGNSLDIQKGGVNELSVDYNGNINQVSGSSTTDTINGQTISAAASFTGTVTVATSVLTPLVDTASAGTLNVGTTNAMAIDLNQNTQIANNKSLTALGPTVMADATNSTTAFQVETSGSSSTILDVDTSNGEVGIGTNAPNSQSTKGSLTIVGTTSDNTANSLAINSSVGNNIIQARNDGYVGIGEAAGTPLGNTTEGTLSNTGWNGIFAGEQFTTGGAMTITSMSAYVDSVQVSNNQYQFAIYTDSAGAPHSLVATSPISTLNSSNAWNTAAISASLSASTKYWLMYMTNTTISTDNYIPEISSTGGTYAFFNNTWASGFPSTAPVPTGTSAAVVSIYASTSTTGPALIVAPNGQISAGNENPNADFQVFTAANTNQAFQVQNSNGYAVLNVDTSGNTTTLGNITTNAGQGIAGQLDLADGSSDGFGGLVKLSGALTANATYNLPNLSGTQTICTSNSTSCSSTYQVAGSYLLQNPAANDASTSNFAGYQYSFTQNNTGAAGNLQLTNSGTNPSLDVVGSGNPSGTNALEVINNSAGTPSGNSLDIQKGGVNELSVDYNGNISQINGTTTTDTINGQTISSAASFTGTVTAATSLLAPLVDTASSGVLAVGTTNATAIDLNQNTVVASGKNLTLNSGDFTQTSAETSGNAHSITANSVTSGNALTVSATGLTTGKALNVTSAENSAANSSWSAVQFNVTNAQGTTAVSGTNLIAGLDEEFTQNTSVAGNNTTVANFAIAQNNSASTDATVNSIINLANNDTATGNQITASNGLLINGANVTNGINLSGTFGTSLITASHFSVSQAGAIVGVGVNSGSGLIQGTGGMTLTGTTQINATGSGTTTIGNTGAGAVQLASGGASSFTVTGSTLALGGTNFNLATTGVVTLEGGTGGDITTTAGTAANGLVFQPGNSTTATSTGAGMTIQGGNDSGATASTGGLLTLDGGNATGGSQTGGGVAIDSGTGTTGGAVTIGGSNAASVSIGRSGKTTSVVGNTTVGTANNGALFKNNGATENTECAYTGASGTLNLTSVGKTVNDCSAFTITDTGATTLTSASIGTPTAGAGSIIYINNLSASTSAITVLGVSLPVGDTTMLIYDGTNWTGGASASGGTVTLQNAYNNSGSAAPSILTTTASAVTVQPAITGGQTGAQEIFGVHNALTGNTLGTSILSVTSYGIGVNLGSSTAQSGYDIQFDGNSNRVIGVISATAANQQGGNLTVEAGGASTTGLTTGAIGGALDLYGGNAAGSNNNAGGAVAIQGGVGSTNGAGGAVSLTGGTAAGTGTGGTATLQGGSASSTAGSIGGSVAITGAAGAASSAAGTAGGASGGVTINSGAGGANTATSGTSTAGSGSAITVTGGNGGAISSVTSGATAGAGANISLIAGTGGNAPTGSGTNGNGGSIYLTPGQAGSGAGTGVGIPGVVYIDTPVFTASSLQTYSSSSTITKSLIDSNSTVLVSASTANITVTVPAPTNTATGRTIFVTVASGSNSFFLALTGGPTIFMSANTTAQLVWNNSSSAWTGNAADTSLQGVYNDTSAAPATIVTTSSTKTIQFQAGASDDSASLFNVESSTANYSVLDVDSVDSVVGVNLGTQTAVSGTPGIELGGNQNENISVISAAATNAAGANLTVTAASANSTGVTTGNVGGVLTLKGGNAAGSGNNAGGSATLQAGASTGTTIGGQTNVNGGAASSTGPGGEVVLTGANGGASAANGAGAGGNIVLQGGSAAGGNNSGGSITLTAGSAHGTTGSGIAPGVVSIGSPVFNSTTETDNQTANGQSFNVVQGDLDTYGTIVVDVTGAFTGATVTMPSPTNTIAGRMVLVSAASGSVSFTLAATGMSSVNMAAGSTATLIWNGSSWSGTTTASSLQQVYNNTSTAPASIITTSTTKNILFQAGVGDDNADVFQVGNSDAAPIINVNTTNTATGENVADNGGVESGLTGWTAYTGSVTPTILLNSTSSNLASGSGSVDIHFAGAGSGGVQNDLGAAALTASSKYNVSFDVKASTGSPTLTVQYCGNSTCTATGDPVSCTVPTNGTVNSTSFFKYVCYFSTGATTTTTNFLRISLTASGAMDLYVDNLFTGVQNTAGTADTGDLQVGGPLSQGLTLLTLDTFASDPFTGTLNQNLYGSMYYNTTLGRIQCYESDGWGSCGAAPDTNLILEPEYAGAVLNPGSNTACSSCGTTTLDNSNAHIGTMTANICSGSALENINPTVCTVSSQEYNYYQWTTSQVTSQSYSIYVKYQLPPTFGGFASSSTIQMVGQASNSNAAVYYTLFSANGTECKPATLNTDPVDPDRTPVTTTTGSFQTVSLQADPTNSGTSGCSFSPNDVITFRVDLYSDNNADAYAGQITFTMLGK